MKSSSSSVVASTKLVRSLSSDLEYPVTIYRKMNDNDGDDLKTENKETSLRYKAVVGDQVFQCCSYDRNGFTQAKKWLLSVCTTELPGIIYKQSEERKGLWYTHSNLEFSTALLQSYQLINAQKSENTPTSMKQKIVKYNPSQFPAFKCMKVTLFAKIIQSETVCSECYANTALLHLEIDDSPWEFFLCADCMHARCWKCELCSIPLRQSELHIDGDLCSNCRVSSSIALLLHRADVSLVPGAAVMDRLKRTCGIVTVNVLPVLNCKTTACIFPQCARRARWSLCLEGRTDTIGMCKSCLYKSVIRCCRCNEFVKSMDLPESLLYLAPLCSNCLSRVITVYN